MKSSLLSCLVACAWFACTATSIAAQPKNFSLMEFDYSFQYNIGDGEMNDVFFSRISDVTADENHNVYVLEHRPGSLYSFSASGQLNWRNEKRGPGPGELNQPRSILFHNQLLLLGNQSGTRIDRFAKEGVYLDSWTSDELGTDGFRFNGVLDDSLLVISTTPQLKYGVTVKLISLNDLTTVKEFSVEKPSDEPPIRGFRLTLPLSVLGDKLAIGRFYDNSFEIFNRDLNLVMTIPASDGNFIPPILQRLDGGISASIPVSNRPLVPIEERYWLSSIDWPANAGTKDQYLNRTSEEKHTLIRLFNTEGELVDVLYSGPSEDALFYRIYYAAGGLLAVQFDSEDPVLSVYLLN